MSCKCKKKVEETEPATMSPEDSCAVCAQKHFTQARRALREFGYEQNEDTHDFAVGELGLAICHVREDHPELARKIREIRHLIQYWEYGKIGEKWKTVGHELNMLIRKELNIGAETGQNGQNGRDGQDGLDGQEKRTRTIYVFSNVVYPEKNKIKPVPGDMLVFLNKAESAGYYRTDRCAKFTFHRSQKESYGKPVPGTINQYVFDDTKSGKGFEKGFLDRLKAEYDWNYEIEAGKVKSMTTGYMVVKWLEEKYPKHRIVLVNFGYEVKNSTFRCPWHNWKFEAEALKGFEHVNLEEKTEKQ